MQGPFLRKYGQAATVNFQLYETDGIDLKTDASHASGDTKIMKDEGAEANTSNSFVDEGQGYSITLTSTEMEAARVVVYVVDQTSPKVWLDTVLVIETYGNASAQHAVDLDDGVRAGLTALPNAAADAAGGLPISDAGGLDLDAIKSKTDNLPASPAAVGSEMALEDDAITAAKYDQSTAYPLASNDGSDLTEAGGDGDHLTAVPWNAAWDAEVQSECTDALNAYDPPTDTEMDNAFAALNDLSAAEVNAEVDTAIEDYHLDHLLAADYDPSSKPGVATALLNELIENDGGVARYTANALEEAPGGGGGGATPDVNVVSISGDSDAADNLEADYDGTGYEKTNSSIGGVIEAVLAYIAGIGLDT